MPSGLIVQVFNKLFTLPPGGDAFASQGLSVFSYLENSQFGEHRFPADVSHNSSTRFTPKILMKRF